MVIAIGRDEVQRLLDRDTARFRHLPAPSRRLVHAASQFEASLAHRVSVRYEFSYRSRTVIDWQPVKQSHVL